MKQQYRSAHTTFFIIVLFLFSLLSAGCSSVVRQPDTPTEALPEVSGTSLPYGTVSPTPSVSAVLPAAPVFSQAGGFYDTAFTLTLSGTGNHEIYYTLDGSDPRVSETALRYKNGIPVYNNTSEPNTLSAIAEITLSQYTPPTDPVDKGIIVRAVSRAADGTCSEVITNSYFIEKSASYYTQMKVFSLITEPSLLFDPNDGAYMVGTGYYIWLNSDAYVPYVPGDVNNPTNYNKDGRESEFPVTVQVFENGALAYSMDVGARISGNWSRESAQKSLRLYARKQYGDGKMNYAFFSGLTDATGELIQTFDKITLRNGGNDNLFLHFRDALVQELAAGLTVDTMASEPCILFINGEFWGFYLLREKPEDEYIEAHYGIPKEHVTVIKNGSLESGSEEDMEDLKAFFLWAQTADMTNEANYAYFCDTFDVQCFMDYMTVETYVNNADWANGGLNNWMLWRSTIIDPSLPRADRKWRFIFYDLDMTAGLYGNTETSFQYDSLGTIHASYLEFNYPGLLRNVMKNDSFREAFYENYLHIMETCFSPKTVNEKISEYVAAYSDATLDTFYRFGAGWSAASYSNEVVQLRNFFNNRPTYAKRYLISYCNKALLVKDNLLQETTFWTFYGPASYLADETKNTFLVNVPEATGQVWDIQSQANQLALEPGCLYQLTFEASCTTATDFDIGINRYDGSEYPSCWWTSASLTPELTQFTFLIVTDQGPYSDWRLCFNFGNAAGDYLIQNAKLIKSKENQQQ